MDAALTKEGNTLGATLLITGCCIGAGMIGLPVMSAMAGFIPSILAMLLCYFLATGTGLLILEAILWFDQRVNLISMEGFQHLIPTLTYYVKKNVAAIRTAIFVGNLIPFLIYFVWNFVILGIHINKELIKL
jgi:amino acid permease